MRKITSKQRLEYRDSTVWECTRGRLTKEQAVDWAEVLLWGYSHTYKYMLEKLNCEFIGDWWTFESNTDTQILASNWKDYPSSINLSSYAIILDENRMI